MTSHGTLLIDFSVKLATHTVTECNKQKIYIFAIVARTYVTLSMVVLMVVIHL